MSRPTTLTGPWLALAQKFKSIEAMAAALGVDPRTIRRWHDGQRLPHPIVKNAIDTVARKYGVTLIWKRKS
jgi:DNA-binding transcriptional regulator YiaG